MMPTISKILVPGAVPVFGLALVVAGAVVGTSDAFAQPEHCGCLIGAGTAGAVQSAQGNVFVSQVNGSAPAQAKMQLQAGSSVIVGPQSTSVVSFGNNCTLRLRANTVLKAVRQGDQLCVAVDREAVDGITTASTAAGSGFVRPVSIFGGLAGGAAAIAIADERKSVSN